MRIVFIGTVLFSKRALEKLISLKAEIACVFWEKTSNFHSDFADLSGVCEKHGISHVQTDDINSENNLKIIRELAPDIIFCFGWSFLLKADLLAIPPMGVVGFHPAALPANRGRHPLIWALALGLEETGVTFFFMDERADSGDILSQRIIPILPEQDAGDLYEVMVDTALKQIEEFLPQLQNRTYSRIKQDHSKSNTWRKRSVVDGQIGWRMSAESIHNLVRALARPYPGVHFVFNGREIKVWKTELIPFPQKNIEPGKLLDWNNGMPIVKCGQDAIKLVTHEWEEKLGTEVYLWP